MTSEIRNMISVDEIGGIEIECAECHTAIFYPISKLSKIDHACSQCGGRWFDSIPSAQRPDGIYPAIESILAVAAEIRSLTRRDRTDVHANLRLRVNLEQVKK